MGNLLQGLVSPNPTPTITPGVVSNPNVINYPGTDPYYGITLYDLAIPGLAEDTSSDSSSTPSVGSVSQAGSRLPTYRSGLYNERGVQSPTMESLKAESKWLDENYPDWYAPFIGADASQDSGLGGSVSPFGSQWQGRYGAYRPGGTSSSTPAAAGGTFKIAKPNMTWVNNMPSVMPAGGAALAAKYGPLPFSIEAGTPYPTPIPRELTYNNPYNTNPYLPTANPFALIANSPTSGS
jgi:hypothetical protein